MEIIKTGAALNAEQSLPIGEEQLKKLTEILQKYQSGLHRTKSRVISSENWWKLRNAVEEQRETGVSENGGFKSVSGWLHNLIVSKHADAMDSYPEPNILPREQGDAGEARMLTAIIPCILEHNHFEHTYSDNMWQKCKFGTGVYKVVWDSAKLGGLGDISIETVSLLDLYWEPGIKDIQKSRYFFHTELCDKEILKERYPDLLGDKLKGQSFISSKFNYDDTVDTTDKATVIDVYYHKIVGGKSTLQYVKYVDDVVLFATENETQPITDRAGNIVKPPMAEVGLYEHNLYPYIFDPLFPIEGSPCGYGLVDIARNPQTEIDLMKTAFVANTMVGSKPRYFYKEGGGGINESEFLDTNKPIVHVKGNIDEMYLRPIAYNSLDGNYLNMLNSTIQELRETSGNTETAAGVGGNGATAASALAILSENSGKTSRDSNKAAYRAYGALIEICIELIRQFYDVPRKFRVLGQLGFEQYVTYTNEKLKSVDQGMAFGQDLGMSKPTFDVKISAQKKNAYAREAQNQLSVQFFQLGFFDPQRVDQALMCIEMMEFEGKDALTQKLARNGTMYKKLVQYMQMAIMLAQKAAPEMVEGFMRDFAAVSGQAPRAAGGSAEIAKSMGEGGRKEPAQVKKARARAANSTQPGGH